MKLEVESDFDDTEQAYRAITIMAIEMRNGAKSGIYRTPHDHIVKMKWKLVE